MPKWHASELVLTLAAISARFSSAKIKYAVLAFWMGRQRRGAGSCCCWTAEPKSSVHFSGALSLSSFSSTTAVARSPLDSFISSFVGSIHLVGSTTAEAASSCSLEGGGIIIMSFVI
jgi:hypothetical protein